MKDLTCKFDGKEDRPFYGVFKAITSIDTAISKKTSSLFGEFDKDKNRTVFNWGISEDLYEDPSVAFNATLESLKQGTVQLCIYHDTDF
jgi:hypothetical protein